MAAAEHPLYVALRATYDVDAALPVARAALGLMASLRAWCELGHAPVVALCANVCHDVVAAVLGARCRPVFLDIDPSTGMVPDREWQRARAAGASAAIVVHLYGNASDVAAVRAHFPTGTTLLIDDAAQALGACNLVGQVGGQGDVGLLSFGATKHITAGGAVLLIRVGAFAERVCLQLASIPVMPKEQADGVRAAFRRGLEAARARLRESGGEDVDAFAGLLSSYSAVLGEVMPEGRADAVWLELQGYASMREVRCAKAAAWELALRGCGLLPVGMGLGAVPWRYVCRLPGIGWASQHRLAEAMRARGVDVSHWYLPAHWMCGEPTGSLPGVERLAGEIFQFWIDPGISMENIRDGATTVREVLGVARP